jgi:transposase-like protein
MAYTKIDWAKARRDFELAGMSVGKIAQKYGVTASAVLHHKKQDGWTRDEAPADPETISAGFSPEQTIPVGEVVGAAARQRIAELERQLAEAEKENREQRAELEKHRPTVEWHVYRTTDQVRDFFGEDRLRDIAGLELAAQNKERVKRGLPPFTYQSDPDLYERQIARILKEMLDRRTKWVDANKRVRVVKMAGRNADGSGWNAVQIPVEVQINNEAGQSGAAIWKQRDKGRKLITPYLCQRIDCWLEAAVGGDGKFSYAGYCSQEHMAADPYIGQAAQPGVAMSRAVGM